MNLRKYNTNPAILLEQGKAIIGNISMDDITLDNFPIKAYLVSVETYNEAKANEKTD